MFAVEIEVVMMMLDGCRWTFIISVGKRFWGRLFGPRISSTPSSWEA